MTIKSPRSAAALRLVAASRHSGICITSTWQALCVCIAGTSHCLVPDSHMFMVTSPYWTCMRSIIVADLSRLARLLATLLLAACLL